MKAFFLAMVAVVAAIGLGGVALVYSAAQSRNERQRQFMTDCGEHRLRYECTYLWMSAHRDRGDAPLIIPMPVPIPYGR